MNPRHLSFHLFSGLALAVLLGTAPVHAQVPRTSIGTSDSIDTKETRTERKARHAAARANSPRTNEWDRNQNAPKPLQGTRESRKAESRDARALVKRQARAGELPRASDEWSRQQSAPVHAAETRVERKAERQIIRAELKEANRRGEIPMPDEAGLGYANER